MRCYECGGTYQGKNDSLTITDKFIGSLTIQGILYYQCDTCGDILYTEEMSLAIEAERNRRIQEVLVRFPLGDYLSSSQTCALLEISRQALHKNRRIQRGFIYQTKIGESLVYLKPSVLLFKETGDGRFPLHLCYCTPSAKYEKATIDISNVPAYREGESTISRQSQFRMGSIDLKEYTYAK